MKMNYCEQFNQDCLSPSLSIFVLYFCDTIRKHLNVFIFCEIISSDTEIFHPSGKYFKQEGKHLYIELESS